MPKRTNAFQELAAILHTKPGPGWKIGESLFLTDAIAGEPREVDVVARARNTCPPDSWIAIDAVHVPLELPVPPRDTEALFFVRPFLINRRKTFPIFQALESP